MPAVPDVPGSAASSPTQRDIDAVCHALETIKQTLRTITPGGGGEPGLDLLIAIAEDYPDAVIVCTPRSEIRMVNGAAVHLTGFSRRELQTLTLWDLTHSSAQGDFDVLWREFLRAGRQRGMYTLRHRSGSPLEVAYCAELRVLGALGVAVLKRSIT